MENLKIIFAQNLIFLRKQSKLTQIELAEKLHYSDKAVSKWERGDSIPDVVVLKSIADLFGVSIDFLITYHQNDEIENAQTDYSEKIKKKNRKLITGITFFAVLVISTIVFVSLSTMSHSVWQKLVYCYVYPLPVYSVIGIVLASLWGNRPVKAVAVSSLVWSLLLTWFFIFLFSTQSILWEIFIIGIIAEPIILFSFKIKTKKD